MSKAKIFVLELDYFAVQIVSATGEDQMDVLPMEIVFVWMAIMA